MKEIDCLGMRCPIPIIECAKALAILEIGESLILNSDDPATYPDLKAWSRMTGNDVSTLTLHKFLITRQNQMKADAE